jgi:hypothetical protein
LKASQEMEEFKLNFKKEMENWKNIPKKEEENYKKSNRKIEENQEFQISELKNLKIISEEEKEFALKKIEDLELALNKENSRFKNLQNEKEILSRKLSKIVEESAELSMELEKKCVAQELEKEMKEMKDKIRVEEQLQKQQKIFQVELEKLKYVNLLVNF